jgi:F420-non-reducing hydrogenase small subunit
MADKPKVAIYWLAACGGCDEAIVDLNEAILEVAAAVDIVLWPIAMDFKYESIREMKDNEIALSIIHGSVRNSEQEEMAILLRKKSRIVLASGACACFGGTAGLANFRSKEDIFDWVYRDAPSVVNPHNTRPQPETLVDGNKLGLPELYDHVYPLKDVINVDYYLPGCPPPPKLIANAVFAVMEDKLPPPPPELMAKGVLEDKQPPRGATLAPRKALCDVCPRNKSKPLRMEISGFQRIHEVEADENKCFLAQGIICVGPAIRSGCGETCIRTNIPCRGCFGPVEGVDDAGTKFLSGLATLIGAESEEESRKAIDGIGDLAGYCYRFSLPSVSLKHVGAKNQE